jgi:sec-independent protein translocase protein TatA
MFGRLGWLEILVIVVLVLILFGSNKIPGMMKNLADGLNVFKKEIKKETPKKAEAKKVTKKAPARKK